VGKAELVITGKGDYIGTKTITFQIIGNAFSAKTVTIDGLSDQTYNGKAITQNKEVKLTYDGKELSYGTDYTISYTKNINKGTATMTFKGVEENGYSGSIKKTFKINAADISKLTQATDISVEYTKSGATPTDQISLTNANGIKLISGKDYTVKCQNNKAVSAADSENAPTMLIRGKGNYAGELTVPFTITKASLDSEQITYSIKPVAYDSTKPADYEYKFSIKVMDNKKALREKQDYEITYLKNTQEDYETYLEKLKNATATQSDMPRVEITAVENGNYTNTKEVPLPIYTTKLTKSNVTIEVAEANYSGSQATPDVTVYYTGGGERITLEKDKDYTITYGANIQSGNNKGTVTISGLSPYYGGDVTQKFTINPKNVK
jgi:hypothetical protein